MNTHLTEKESTLAIPTPERELLTISEACERLGICDRTFRRMVNAGEFPKPVRFRKSSRRLRVPARDVESYLESVLANRK